MKGGDYEKVIFFDRCGGKIVYNTIIKSIKDEK